MLSFLGFGQEPGSRILYELQLSNGLFLKASEKSIAVIYTAGND